MKNKKRISKTQIAKVEVVTFKVTLKKSCDWNVRVKVEERIHHLFISFKLEYFSIITFRQFYYI